MLFRSLSKPASPATKSAHAEPVPAVKLLDANTFANRLEEEFLLTVQHGWPLSVILVEIDDFNNLREFCGAEISTQIHNDIATLLSRSIRASDMISAQSENRFAILLPGSDADMAAMVATRLVEEAHECIARHEDAGNLPATQSITQSITVSLGVATLNEDTPFARATRSEEHTSELQSH